MHQRALYWVIRMGGEKAMGWLQQCDAMWAFERLINTATISLVSLIKSLQLCWWSSIIINWLQRNSRGGIYIACPPSLIDSLSPFSRRHDLRQDKPPQDEKHSFSRKNRFKKKKLLIKILWTVQRLCQVRFKAIFTLRSAELCPTTPSQQPCFTSSFKDMKKRCLNHLQIEKWFRRAWWRGDCSLENLPCAVA